MLLNFVAGLPITVDAKDFLKAKILGDFLDTEQFDDEENEYTIDEYMADKENPRFSDVKSTYGIVNLGQVERYFRLFMVSLKKTRYESLELQLKEMDKLPPAVKFEKLSDGLVSLTRLEFFAKHGKNEIKDPEWNEQMKEILGSEISFAKELVQIQALSKQDLTHNNKKDDSQMKEKYLVEVLEQSLTLEAVLYRMKIEKKIEDTKFDPLYFDNFISGELLNDFTSTLYSIIKPLGNEDIYKYLNLSLLQFNTHNPKKRFEYFVSNFLFQFRVSDTASILIENELIDYAKQIWEHYATHFHLFKEITEKIKDNYKDVLITIKNEKDKVPQEAYKIKQEYINRFFLSLDNNNPRISNPMDFYLRWRDNLVFFKKEVLGNLIYLNQTSIKSFINALKFEFELLLQYCYTTKEELDALYAKYDTNELEIVSNFDFDHPLFSILTTDSSVYRQSGKDLAKKEALKEQIIFYNFHYEKIIREALDFLAQQEKIHNISSVKVKEPTSISVFMSFENLLDEDKQVFILDLLEDLSITINGISILSERRKGSLRGIVEALRENHILPQLSLDKLSIIIGDKIGLKIFSKIDFSITSDKYKKKAEKYIMEYYKK